MVKTLLALSDYPQEDAADALAIALCHAHTNQGLDKMQGVTGKRGSRLQ
jgi:crossover junction endodeoxyribonuclease RuvC